MSFLSTSFRVLWSKVLPIFVLIIAIFVGWLLTQEQPAGVLFATVFPLMNGHLPPTIVGHGIMTGTPEVPRDMLPQPRPEHEMFLELPGGYKMPQAGLGMCCRYSAYDDVLVRRTVLWYLLLGGRHIDAAHLYLNHHAIGLGINDAIARGIPRDEIFVTTKIFPSHYGYNLTLATIPKFLDELQLEYIDLLLMHSPVTVPLMGGDCGKKGLSQKDCRAETYKALTQLRDTRIVRNVGVSNFAVHHLKEIQALALAPIAVNQFQFNPWAPEFAQETYEYCQSHNISVTAYASLGGSLQHSQAATVDTLHALAKKHDKSLPQIMLRWALQSKAAVIPGTGNPEHMKENLDVYTFELDQEDMEAIDKQKSDEGAKKFFYMPPPSE